MFIDLMINTSKSLGNRSIDGMPESHIRSIVKAISWRIGGTAVTFILVWLLSGELRLAAQIGLADTFIKIGAFYVHERLWDKVGLGRKRKPEYEI